MIRPPTRSTRSDTLCPYTALFLSPASATVLPGSGSHTVATDFAQHAADARSIPRFGGDTPRRCRTSKARSEEQTSELPSLMRISYAVFCLTKKSIYRRIESSMHPQHTHRRYLLYLPTHRR